MQVPTSVHSAITWDLLWVLVHIWWNYAAPARAHSVKMRYIHSTSCRMHVLQQKPEIVQQSHPWSFQLMQQYPISQLLLFVILLSTPSVMEQCLPGSV